MHNRCLAALGAVVVSFALSTSAQFSISPLSSFGGGDGWLSPGEGGYSYLTTGTTERGLAYGNGHLYLVSRAAVAGSSLNIRMLNPTTGADLGGLAVGSGIISGGLFPVNTVRVGTDGAIYVANMSTATPANGNFRVYRWANEGATPTVAYSGAPLTGSRIGDSFDLFGGGPSTLLVAGFGNSPAIAGNNGYAIIDPTLGTATTVGFSGTPPNAGDFRLGLTFTDGTHVLGAPGNASGGTTVRYTSFSGAVGSLDGSPTLAGSFSQRILDFTMLGSVPLLASQSTGDSRVRIFDFTDPLNPVLLGELGNTSGTLTANGNGTGQMAWGDAVLNPDGTWSAPLWTMSTSQGIQAFIVTIPEPGTGALASLAVLALVLRRKLRQ